MRLLLSFFGCCLLFFLGFPPTWAASDNCALDITAELAEDTDWRTVHILRAPDGSLWQRALVNHPENTLHIKEDGIYQVSGFAAANSEIQIFFTTPVGDLSVPLAKPGIGTCFETDDSDEFGFFRFRAHSRILWQGLGKEMMIDAFFRLDDETAARIEEEQSASGGYFATSYNFPRLVRIALDQEYSAELEDEALQLNTPQALDDPLAVNDPRAIKNIVSDRFRDIDGSCELLCPNIPIYRSVLLMPWEIPSRLLGDNLSLSGGKQVAVGRAMNTYYVGIDGQSSILKRNSDDIALKALAMEMIKRMQGIDENTTPKAVRQNAVAKQGLEHVRALLVGEGEREDEARFLKRAANIPNNVPLAELFPAYASTEQTWAEDFLTLIDFWTDGLQPNSCLIMDTSRAHLTFLDGVEGATTDDLVSSPEQCEMVQTNGITPLLLLHAQEAMQLSPRFHQTRIVASDQDFTHGESFHFPQGDKSPLAYEYRFSERFSSRRLGEMCVQKPRLPNLIATVADAYGLSARETRVLAQELHTQFPTEHSDTFVHFSLADPSDITERFVWQGNGKHLSLLQLFFEMTPEACDREQLDPPQFPIPLDRDGFEVGILP